MFKGLVRSFGSGQKMRDWAVAAVLQKLKGATRLALKPESVIGARVILVIGGLALPAGKAWTTPCFPRSRASPLPSNIGIDEVGVEFGEDLGDEDRFVRVIAVTVIRDRKRGGIAPNIARPHQGPG